MFGIFKREQKQQDNNFVDEYNKKMEETRVKRISQPVYSIVKSMKERPDTFEFKEKKSLSVSGSSFFVHDTLVRANINLMERFGLYCCNTRSISGALIIEDETIRLTTDETELLLTKVKELCAFKKEQKAMIEAARQNKLREKATSLYEAYECK